MVAGTVLYPSLAVLASSLLPDLGLTASGFGLLVFSFSVVSALASPYAGGVADRLGGRRAVTTTFLLTGAGFLAVAASPSLGLLTGATLIVAGGQALMNPATNRLIRDHTQEGRRGAVTGIKQSGVYVGYVLAGALAPAVATTAGWRTFFVATGVVLMAGAPVARMVLPHDRPHAEFVAADHPPIPGWVWVLAGYGFLMGTASSSGTFLPLYAETQLGFTPILAGLLTSFLGMVAIGTRILGARAAERGRRYRGALSVAAATGIAFAAIVVASPGAPSLIWAAAVAFALGLSAWNAIGMLAVIDLAGPRLAGAATGRVLLGFLSGLAIGPLVFGRLIDEIGFGSMWLVTGTLAAGAFAVARAWRPRAA
jgi:predicted MFS family arabinose efflux permease